LTLPAVAAVAAGYLLGAIPFGVIAARLAGGMDPRQLGSRRTGSTNVMRALGLRWALPVLVADVAKGVAAVVLARWLMGDAASGEWVAAGSGLAAVVGHTWSIFIGLRGGRGVATAGGGLLAMAPLAVAILIPVMLVVVWRTRYVSAASLSAALLAPVVTGVLAVLGLTSAASLGFGLAIGIMVTATHRDNIRRLRAGTERRIGK
jgi:acyl phosphate:glycerol-3-phosphate acyltransferase